MGYLQYYRDFVDQLTLPAVMLNPMMTVHHWSHLILVVQWVISLSFHQSKVVVEPKECSLYPWKFVVGHYSVVVEPSSTWDSYCPIESIARCSRRPSVALDARRRRAEKRYWNVRLTLKLLALRQPMATVEFNSCLSRSRRGRKTFFLFSLYFYSFALLSETMHRDFIRSALYCSLFKNRYADDGL